MMTSETLRALLKSHDWWYMMADDPSAYRMGEASYRRLKVTVRKHPDQEEAKELWKAHAPEGFHFPE